MPVVGTAGHVDHGKSTLIAALTGRDPDRWAEEKRRGLTIDLGFAWAELPGGQEVSFVDVPGHERFIKNMLAGIEAIDAGLFVVAADEGWMPQSEEHLAVLDLLDVRAGVVALTKVDRVDPDLQALAAEEVADRMAGTTLEAAVVVPVSATSGHGLDRLTTELAAAVDGAVVPPPAPPRLWVDRAFSVAGAGTVVTGTLLGAPLTVGDEIEIWPGGRTARIRALQSHERDVDVVAPHRRVAVNLAGTGRGDLDRGSMIGEPGAWRPSTRFLVAFRTARYVDELTDRGAYHLHTGSGGWPATVRILDQSDGRGLALVTTRDPLCLPAGDRFVLRDTGRRAVVAGGRVLDPGPARGPRVGSSATRLLAAIDEGADARAAALLETRGMDQVVHLTVDSGGGMPPSATIHGPVAVSEPMATGLQHRIRQTVEDYHRRHPLRPGAGIALVASGLGVETEVVAGLAADDPGLLVEGGTLRPAGAGPVDPTADPRWPEAKRKLASSWPLVPTPSELGIDAELAHALERRGELVRIGTDLAYLPDQVEELRRILAGLGDGFTVSAFRDAAGMSRKYAVPILEWADRTGLTVRTGDVRRYRGG